MEEGRVNKDTSTGRVVLAVPDRLFRESLAGRLPTVGIDVAWQGSDIAEVPQEVLNERGIILIAHLAEGDGVLEKLRALKSANPDSRIVIIGRSASPTMVAACLEAGVNTILDEDVSFESFLNYLRFAMAGEQVLPADVASTMLEALRPYLHASSQAQEAEVKLSLREKVILAYLAEGASNKQIAGELGIADSTVKVSIKTILRKIDAKNRTQAAVWALEHDIRASLMRDGVEFNGHEEERSRRRI